MFLANMYAARKYQFVLLGLFAGVLVSSRTQAQGKIVGYYAAYKASVLPCSQVEYSNLTDINVAFAYPNTEGLPSGVYFYRIVASPIQPLNAGSRTATGKMILLK